MVVSWNAVKNISSSISGYWAMCLELIISKGDMVRILSNYRLNQVQKQKSHRYFKKWCLACVFINMTHVTLYISHFITELSTEIDSAGSLVTARTHTSSSTKILDINRSESNHFFCNWWSICIPLIILTYLVNNARSIPMDYKLCALKWTNL